MSNLHTYFVLHQLFSNCCENCKYQNNCALLHQEDAIEQMEETENGLFCPQWKQINEVKK